MLETLSQKIDEADDVGKNDEDDDDNDNGDAAFVVVVMMIKAPLTRYPNYGEVFSGLASFTFLVVVSDC
jgi:hypothetical protein